MGFWSNLFKEKEHLIVKTSRYGNALFDISLIKEINYQRGYYVKIKSFKDELVFNYGNWRPALSQFGYALSDHYDIVDTSGKKQTISSIVYFYVYRKKVDTDIAEKWFSEIKENEPNVFSLNYIKRKVNC